MRYIPKQYGDWCKEIEIQLARATKSAQDIADKLDGTTQDEVSSRAFFEELAGKLLDINTILCATEARMRMIQ